MEVDGNDNKPSSPSRGGDGGGGEKRDLDVNQQNGSADGSPTRNGKNAKDDEINQ